MGNLLLLGTDPDRATRLMDTIHLPSLQYLCLSSSRNIKEVSNILSRITVPPTESLRFVLTIGKSEENTIVDALASTIFVVLFSDGPRPYHILPDIYGRISASPDGSVSSVPNFEVIAPQKVVQKSSLKLCSASRH